MLDSRSEHPSKGARSEKLTARQAAESITINAPETFTLNESEPPPKIAEYDLAIKRKSASFVQLATPVFYKQEQFNPDPRARAVYERYIEPLTEAFQREHGAITHSFYCVRIIAAAVLTKRLEFWVTYPAPQQQEVGIAEILSECERLNVESDRVLAGPDRSQDLKTIKLLIYTVVSKLLSLFDTQTRPPRAIMDLHWREVRQAQDYYLRAALRYAKVDYIWGMVFGVCGCAAFIAVSAFSTWAIFNPNFTGGTLFSFFWAAVAGSVGAIVSVMSRMTFGELTLDYEAGREILIMLGAFRPVIGMVFGAAMWVLSASGVFAIVPNELGQPHFFQILIAFLAGFSERFAQDMLSRAADQIGGIGTAGKTSQHKRVGLSK
jgi:hypothetical protein